MEADFFREVGLYGSVVIGNGLQFSQSQLSQSRAPLLLQQLWRHTAREPTLSSSSSSSCSLSTSSSYFSRFNNVPDLTVRNSTSCGIPPARATSTWLPGLWTHKDLMHHTVFTRTSCMSEPRSPTNGANHPRYTHGPSHTQMNGQTRKQDIG